MGAVPKKKPAKGRQLRRRGNHQLRIPHLVPCENCNELKIPHRVCPRCGYYKDREIIEIEA